MNKKVKNFLFVICALALGAAAIPNVVKAKSVYPIEIETQAYVIGNHIFNRENEEEYKGVLTTKYIMLASKTIESNELDDMIIYYKNSRGLWKDAITNKEIQLPERFEIRYKNGKELEYNITFDTDGGSQMSSIKIKDGEKISITETPIKEGYTFVEWRINDKKYDLDTIPTSDLTLKAIWAPNEYRIIYVANDVTGTMENTIFYHNSEVTLRNNLFVKEGYRFMGWATNADGDVTYTNSQKISGLNKNITLYAVFEPENYTITYNLDGGTANNNPTTYNINSGNITIDNPTKQGYMFIGWTQGENDLGKDLVIPTGTTGNIVLNANYEKDKYSIQYNSNAQYTSGTMNNTNFEYQDSVILDNNGYTREGYNFKGWATTANGQAIYTNSQNIGQINSNLILYAVWEAKTYTVKIEKRVDEYSPDIILGIYENETKITIKELKYLDGNTIAKGDELVVNPKDIDGETSFTVVLPSGNEVIAILEVN